MANKHINNKNRVIDRACQIYGKNLKNISETAVALICVGAGIDLDTIPPHRANALKKLVSALQCLSYTAAIQAILDGAALGTLQPFIFVKVDLMEQPCSEETFKEFTECMCAKFMKECSDGE